MVNPAYLGNTDNTEIYPVGVKALFQQENGDIWIATRMSEVFLIGKDGKLKQHFSRDNYLIGNVYHIMQDRKGRLWFSTKGEDWYVLFRMKRIP